MALTVHNQPGSKFARLIADVAVGREHMVGIPLDIVQRLERAPGMYHETALIADIGAGLVHGYDADPELFRGWQGVGMEDFIWYLVEQRGLPAAPAVFGMDAAVVEKMKFQKIVDVAGLARAAVLGVTVQQLAACPVREGQKVHGARIPQLSWEGSLETWFALERHESMMPIAELFDMPVTDIAANLDRIKYNHSDPASLTAVLVRATRDGLNLERTFDVYALGVTDYPTVRQAVTHNWPNEYVTSYISGAPTARGRRQRWT